MYLTVIIEIIKVCHVGISCIVVTNECVSTYLDIVCFIVEQLTLNSM